MNASKIINYQVFEFKKEYWSITSLLSGIADTLIVIFFFLGGALHAIYKYEILYGMDGTIRLLIFISPIIFLLGIIAAIKSWNATNKTIARAGFAMNLVLYGIPAAIYILCPFCVFTILQKFFELLGV